MRIISFFTIWMVGVFAVQAQTVTADTYLDSARIEYYRNKDFRSILLLNQFLKDYPDHALADEVKLVVGTLYQTKKDFQQAIPIFKSALALENYPDDLENYRQGERYKPRPIPQEEDVYYPMLIIKSLPQQEMRYQAAEALYDMYLDKQQFDSCLFYLKVAKKYTSTQGGCGNGYISGLNMLTRQEARVHLLKRDTMQACRALFSCILNIQTRERDSASEDLLTHLLYTVYSPEEIATIVDSAIANAYLTTKENGAYVPHFVLLEQPVTLWLGGMKTDQELKAWLLKEPYLSLLRQTE